MPVLAVWCKVMSCVNDGWTDPYVCCKYRLKNVIYQRLQACNIFCNVCGFCAGITFINICTYLLFYKPSWLTPSFRLPFVIADYSILGTRLWMECFTLERDWHIVTTDGFHSNQLMCHAHSKGIQYGTLGNNWFFHDYSYWGNKVNLKAIFELSIFTPCEL